MTACWSFEPESRPSVDHITELLSCSPFLVQPCLDCPCTAVAMDSRGSMEMSLPPKGRYGGAIQGSSVHSQLKTMAGVSIQPERSSAASHGGLSLSGGTSSGMTCSNARETLCMLDQPLQPLHQHQQPRNARFSAPTPVLSVILCPGSTPSAPAAPASNGPTTATAPSPPVETQTCEDFSPTSGPESPLIQSVLGTNAAEEKGDSDYCSDNSKEFSHVTPSSTV